MAVQGIIGRVPKRRFSTAAEPGFIPGEALVEFKTAARTRMSRGV